MPSEAATFLELLFADNPGHLFIRLWVPSWNHSCWVPYVDDAAECAESLAAGDVYVGLGLASRDYSATENCASLELAALAGVSIDIDLCSDAHAPMTRPPTAEQAISILPTELPPTCIVHTGDGVQACWLFRDRPCPFENDEQRRQAAGLASRLHTLVRGNARLRGWTINRQGDMACLVRIPGTTNCEDPANPKPVTIIACSEHRYTASELIEYLDDQDVPDQGAEAAAKQEWSERFKGKPLTINLAARIPDDLLNQWMAGDLVFKSTWFRQRTDLPDQSQSQYDLALTRFGVSGNIEAQQIVDLIVHHRATYRHKPRTRLDYYYRTLAKVATRNSAETTDGPARESKPHDQRPEAPGPAGGAPSPSNPDRAKIALCDELSETFGVEVLRIVKLSGQDPTYRIELATGRVHFENVGKFISQRAVRSAIAARAGILIPDFEKEPWRQIVQLMLDACVDEYGGAELEFEGAAQMFLSQYLSAETFIPSIAGQSPQDLLKPLVSGGRITISAADLTAFINKSAAEKLSVKAVALRLSAMGAKSIRVRGNKSNKFKEQSRWELPVEDFDPADYVPAMGGVGQNG